MPRSGCGEGQNNPNGRRAIVSTPTFTVTLTRERDRERFGVAEVHVSAGERLARQICRCYNALGASVKLVSSVGGLVKNELYTPEMYRKSQRLCAERGAA
jgi:hypothetical protein